MIFFFGSRTQLMGTEIAKEPRICPYCKTENRFALSFYRKYYHFFFIPIFTSDRFSFAECLHCKKSFDISAKTTIEKQKNIQDSRSNLPFWKSNLGRTLKIMSVVITIFLVLDFFINKDKKGEEVKVEESETETDIRESYLRQDLSQLQELNYEENSKIADVLKLYVSESLDGINTSEIKYFTKISGNKLLVLVKVDDMKHIKASSRKQLVFAIEECLNKVLNLDTMEQYIGIHGFWNMLMIRTPKDSNLSGRFADQGKLLGFYD